MTRALLAAVIEERFDLVETMLDDIAKMGRKRATRQFRNDLTHNMMQIVDAELAELGGESAAYWLMTGEGAC